jgi:arylsulfatase A-like enzyme
VDALTAAAESAPKRPSSDRPPAPAGAPHVVVIVLSTQRRDQWGVYGGPDTTPYLTDRAANGVVMSDALAVAVTTAPSLAAILTGQYPHALRVVDPAPVDRGPRISPQATTLAERFAAAGWFTLGATAVPEIGRSGGGGQGFDGFADLTSDGGRTPAPVVVTEALALVAGRPADRPLFLVVALNDSRKPDPDRWHAPDAERPWVGPYRASIRAQDAAVASLVDGLAASGIEESSGVFVVLSEHGEGLKLPSHHRLQHGIVLYDSTVAVPWLWWGRGLPRGATVSGLASQVDLAPTLLALAGVAGFEGDGLDLSAAVRSGGRTGRAEAYADTFAQGFERASIWTAEFQCQRDYGSVNRPPDDDFVGACFDRRADPQFRTPLAETSATRELSGRLEALHAARVAELSVGVP